MATVKLTELFKQNRFTSSDNQFKIRPVYINPDFVVCLRVDLQTLKLLKEDNKLMPEFHKADWDKKLSVLTKFKDERLQYFGIPFAHTATIVSSGI